MADRAKFLDFLDMIDGGGAGQRGNQFEGGGIFSMLANLMPINPYGSEDPTRRRARDEFFAEQGITPEQAAATPAVIRALPFDAGPITQDMRPRERTFPQSNQFIPEMPVMPAEAPSVPNQFIPEMPVSPSGVMPPMSQNMMESGTRPIRPMPEALPANLAMPISSSKPFPPASQEIGPSVQQPEGMMMSKQQFVNFILPKYREEYGRNPTQQQMDMAYNTYMSNMGIANNSTNDTSSRELELSSSIAPKADEVFNVLDFANKIAQPSFGNAGRGFDYRVTPYNKNDPYAARQNYLGLLQ